ncbi:MAG TPA: preprotein translocase subunit YajC [Candidatus Limnocylindrales bacterium]|nr:preprotein translocase subunit YajC [Candidatus Limnocylindrales bacterium]
MLDAAFAQAAAPPGGPTQADQMLHMVSILALTVGIFYFLIIRPQQRKQKETDAMLSSIKKGDRVLTSGGLYGTVIGKGAKDDVVVLKVADDVKMEFSKQSIVQVVERSG